MKIPVTLPAKIKNSIALALIIFTFIRLVFVWDTLPQRIPAHYDAAGNINSYGGRGTLLILPVVMVLMFILMSVVEKFPSTWNTGVTVTPENRGRVYAHLKAMLDTLKLMICALFAWLNYYQTTLKPLPGAALPITLFLILGTIVYYIVGLVRIK